MQIQQIVAPPKPAKSLKASPGLNTPDTEFYVHPCLTPDNDPCKGRLLRASVCIRAGTVVLRDVPYATVPTPVTDSSSLLCSNLSCSRHVVPSSQGVKCAKSCDRDVVWCNSACRAADHQRHEFECSWLKDRGQVMRHQESQYDFITLWHVVRLLAGWNLEIRKSLRRENRCGHGFKRGWEAVLMCCDYLESWPEAQIKHWTRLAETYMNDKTLLPCLLSPEEMLSLICKEETNTFGLYPGVTGPLYMIDRPVPRGESYGVSLFPRAAMFNHSCQPNVSHKPDDQGRMVFTAARDIAKGEECMITYFDLTRFEDLTSRQGMVQEQFRFRCTCDRCLEEEAQRNLDDIDTLPFCSM